MVSVLAVLFVVVCIFLMFLILVQDPKGGGGGIFGGGGSNSILGSSGTTDLLSKMTQYTALVFGLLCIWLTIATKPSANSVLDGLQPEAATEQTEALQEAPTPEAKDAPAAEPAKDK